MHYFINIANNNIGSCGVKWLTKFTMPFLYIIYLGRLLLNLDKCKIGTEGTKHLIKANWQKLRFLAISQNMLS